MYHKQSVDTSIDITSPLVPSLTSHQPLDVTAHRLSDSGASGFEPPDLSRADHSSLRRDNCACGSPSVGRARKAAENSADQRREVTSRRLEEQLERRNSCGGVVNEYTKRLSAVPVVAPLVIENNAEKEVKDSSNNNNNNNNKSNNDEILVADRETKQDKFSTLQQTKSKAEDGKMSKILKWANFKSSTLNGKKPGGAKKEECGDYTALEFDVNYVKVSPPRLKRRLKKESLSSEREPQVNGLSNGLNGFDESNGLNGTNESNGLNCSNGLKYSRETLTRQGKIEKGIRELPPLTQPTNTDQVQAVPFKNSETMSGNNKTQKENGKDLTEVTFILDDVTADRVDDDISPDTTEDISDSAFLESSGSLSEYLCWDEVRTHLKNQLNGCDVKDSKDFSLENLPRDDHLKNSELLNNIEIVNKTNNEVKEDENLLKFVITLKVQREKGANKDLITDHSSRVQSIDRKDTSIKHDVLLDNKELTGKENCNATSKQKFDKILPESNKTIPGGLQLKDDDDDDYYGCHFAPIPVRELQQKFNSAQNEELQQQINNQNGNLALNPAQKSDNIYSTNGKVDKRRQISEILPAEKHQDLFVAIPPLPVKHQRSKSAGQRCNLDESCNSESKKLEFKPMVDLYTLSSEERARCKMIDFDVLGLRYPAGGKASQVNDWLQNSCEEEMTHMSWDEVMEEARTLGIPLKSGSKKERVTLNRQSDELDGLPRSTSDDSIVIYSGIPAKMSGSNERQVNHRAAGKTDVRRTKSNSHKRDNSGCSTGKGDGTNACSQDNRRFVASCSVDNSGQAYLTSGQALASSGQACASSGQAWASPFREKLQHFFCRRTKPLETSLKHRTEARANQQGKEREVSSNRTETGKQKVTFTKPLQAECSSRPSSHRPPYRRSQSQHCYRVTDSCRHVNQPCNARRSNLSSAHVQPQCCCSYDSSGRPGHEGCGYECCPDQSQRCSARCSSADWCASSTERRKRNPVIKDDDDLCMDCSLRVRAQDKAKTTSCQCEDGGFIDGEEISETMHDQGSEDDLDTVDGWMPSRRPDSTKRQNSSGTSTHTRTHTVTETNAGIFTHKGTHTGTVTETNTGISTDTGENTNTNIFKSLKELKSHQRTYAHSCPWYWGGITIDEAEVALEGRVEGSFLVRDSSDDHFILSLSFRSQGSTHHTRIQHYRGRFSFFSQQYSHDAATIREFIESCMRDSRDGRCLYYLRPRGQGVSPAPVLLLHPVHKSTDKVK